MSAGGDPEMYQAIYDSTLRHSDTLFVNPVTEEWVWLRQTSTGLTDCCLREWPCHHHRTVAIRDALADHQRDDGYDQEQGEVVYACLGEGCAFTTRDWLAWHTHHAEVVRSVSAPWESPFLAEPTPRSRP